MKRPTIADLARTAGVSIATVDRVLTGRAKVREDTAQKVFAAARQIGFHGTNMIRERVLADLPEVHLGFVLQKERQPFYQAFAAQIEETVRAATSRRLKATIRFSPSQVPGDVAATIAAMAGKVQAVAATGLDHHDVSTAVAELKARGIPTFSLLSDFAQGIRESYIGLNNLKVGRTAGWLLSKIAGRPGKVGIFIGGHRFHGHELRETGFRSFFREYRPDFVLLDTLINLETRRLTREATLELMARHPDLVGIYVAGGGMEGAVAAVRETRRPEEIVTLVHELTPDSRQGLLERHVATVFATPLPQLCAELIGMMLFAIDHGMAENPGQRFVAPQIWTPESL